MKTLGLIVFFAAVVAVTSDHTFFGTNVLRRLVYHKSAEFSSKFLQKRVENVMINLPSVPGVAYRTIQGILAYDMTHTTASANVTQGGLGHNFVNIRMKSERGEKLAYDIYVYA